jgi:hypothetical protein
MMLTMSGDDDNFVAYSPSTWIRAPEWHRDRHHAESLGFCVSNWGSLVRIFFFSLLFFVFSMGRSGTPGNYRVSIPGSPGIAYWFAWCQSWYHWFPLDSYASSMHSSLKQTTKTNTTLNSSPIATITSNYHPDLSNGRTTWTNRKTFFSDARIHREASSRLILELPILD